MSSVKSSSNGTPEATTGTSLSYNRSANTTKRNAMACSVIVVTLLSTNTSISLTISRYRDGCTRDKFLVSALQSSNAKTSSLGKFVCAVSNSVPPQPALVLALTHDGGSLRHRYGSFRTGRLRLGFRV